MAQSRTNWLAVLVIYGSGVLAAGQIGKLTPLGASIRGDLGLSLAGFGAAISIVQMLSIVLGVGGGLYAQRYGARRLLVAGLAVCGLGGLAAAFAWSGASFLALRALEGLGYLFVVVTAPTMLGTIAAPRHRNLVLSLWGTFVPVGFAMSGALAGLGEQFWDWRYTVALFSAAAALMGIAVFRLAPATPGQSGTIHFAGLLAAYRIRPLVLLTMGFGAFTTVNVSIIALLPTFLIDERGWLAAEAGSTVGSLILLTVPGSLAMGWILHTATRPWRYAIAVSFISALAVGQIWSVGLPDAALLALVAVVMVTQGMIAAMCFASLPRAVGELRLLALGNGLIVQMGSLGATIGPPAFGFLATALGWPGAGLFLTGGLVVSGLLVFAAIRR
jgi:MFS family permease